MSKMRVLIVDDEALSRQRLRRLVQAEPDTEVIGECADGFAALEAIRDQQPDVVCLDVHMPELDGFGVLQSLRGELAPKVIFVTAYDEHAVRAFEVHAVDYVLKPVDADRFRVAFQRARLAHERESAADRLGQLLDTVRRVSGNGSSALDAVAAESPARRAAERRAAGTRAESESEDAPANGAVASAGPPAYASRILVKHDGRMFFVKVGDIDWIEADRNYVRLHVGAHSHTIRERISHLESTLDPRLFARIHRSTIVNLNRIREMQQWFSGDYVVILENGTRLRLSRHYRDQVERQVGAA
jgi:two-component system LytT family response regulator